MNDQSNSQIAKDRRYITRLVVVVVDTGQSHDQKQVLNMFKNLLLRSRIVHRSYIVVRWSHDRLYV